MLQIPLDFELKVDATFENFVQGQNELLLAALSKITQGESDFLYIHGASGFGKTHLLQAIAHQINHNPDYNLAYLPLNSELLVPQMLSGFEAFDCVCLDDIEAILGQENATEWQEAIFHLYNQLKEADKSLVITAKQAPSGLELQLNDLKSRLSAMYIHEIQALSDEDNKLYLKNKAQEKGMNLNDELVDYLLSRAQRDLSSLHRSLEKLDAASLQAQRKITKPFIKEVLGL